MSATSSGRTATRSLRTTLLAGLALIFVPLIVAFAAGLFVDPDFGPVLANYGIDDLRFITPLNYGDSIKVRLTCKQKTLRGNSGYGEVRWDTEVTNQDDEIVAQYDVLTMVATDAHWASVQ